MAYSDLLVKVGIDSSGFRSGISDLRSQSASLRASMAQMAGTIRDQVKELNAMARAGKTGTDEFKKLEQQIKENEAAFKGMTKEAKYLDKQLQQMDGPKMGNLLGQMGQAVTGGIIGGGVAAGAMAAFSQVQQVIGDAVRVTIDFDDSIRKVAATSGASASEMNMLRDAAIEWGAKTSFSASEAADAMNFMAQAGWNAQQTIDGLPGVLNLAASSGESLGTVAEIVTNNLNAFKLQASDSGRFADVLAAAAAASSTDVGNMGVTFKYVAPLAGALGFSIEDTAIAIGLMANNGIKGSQAGTGLAAVLANMSKPTAEMQREMTKLNVSLVDSAGKVKPLRQLIGELRDSFKTLTPAQQLSSATAIAGKEAMSELLAIVTSTDDAFASMTKQIDNNTGVSKRMADTMEGGVGGALRRLSGSWESLTLVMTGSGSLLDSLANIMADVVGGLAAFAKGNIDVAKAGEEAKMAVMQEQAEMNTLLNVLKTTNAGTDQRKQLIEELNSKYGAYLGNLIDEKTSIQDITKAQNQANAAFRERIKLAASEAMMTAALQKRIELEGRLIETELKIERLQQQRTTAMKDPAALQGLDYALKAAKNTQAELNKEIAASNQQINELEKVAGKAVGSTAKATASASTAIANTTSESLTQISNISNESGKAVAKSAETASSVFNNLQVDLAKSADFYRIIDDEVSALSDRHALLEGAIKKAWSAGGAEAESVIRRIKDELSQMTAARLVPEVKGLPMRGPSQVVSTTATGLQLPKINTTAQADLDAETESLDRQRVAVEALQGAYTSLGQSLGASMEALASGTGTAADALRGLGYSALESAQKFIQAEIAKAIAAQISSNSKLGAIGIGLAGVAIAGIFGLMRGALSQSKSVKLADGGIISGRTMAEVGEYPGAAFNPEVVAPLDKLQAMLDIGGTTQVSGTFRVQGADLVLALDNAQRKMNKFRV